MIIIMDNIVANTITKMATAKKSKNIKVKTSIVPTPLVPNLEKGSLPLKPRGFHSSPNLQKNLGKTRREKP